MIRFNNMEFLTVNSEDANFVPVNVVFNINKVPRLIDASGKTILAWRIATFANYTII